jgi:hypothetical protein
LAFPDNIMYPYNQGLISQKYMGEVILFFHYIWYLLIHWNIQGRKEKVIYVPCPNFWYKYSSISPHPNCYWVFHHTHQPDRIRILSKCRPLISYLLDKTCDFLLQLKPRSSKQDTRLIQILKWVRTEFSYT